MAARKGTFNRGQALWDKVHMTPLRRLSHPTCSPYKQTSPISKRRGETPIPSYHKAIKECGELGMRIERENVRDVLVRPHDNHAAPVTIDSPHVENVMAALQVRTEHFFIVMKSIPALPGQKERGHGLNGKGAMALLEDGPHIDHRVDIRALGCASPDRRLGRPGEKVAQRPQPGGRGSRVFRGGEGEQTPASVRLDCVT